MAIRVSFGSGKGSAGCLALFGLPFAGVGVVMAWVMLSTVVTWQSMRSWVEVPAKIEAAELEEDSGSDSTTYRCTARYSYEYGGRGFIGTRVAIGSGSDNIGSYQQDVYSKLVQYRDSGQDFRCFVNPNEPSEAILFRDLRWGMLLFHSVFVVAFGGVGWGLIFGAFWSMRRMRESNRLRNEHPESPWQWNPDWATGVIRSQNMTQMVAAVAFATLWNVITVPISVIVVSQALEPNSERAALLVLIFPAVGLGLAYWAIYTVLQWRKYGSSIFRMAENPGVIGGKLSGVVEVGRKVRPDDGFHVTLNCINRVTTGSGKNRSTREHILWQNDRVMARELTERDPTRTSIPVAFGIPYTCRETDGSDSDNQILWRLEVKAATPGVDYGVRFEVPVFKTKASRSDFVLDEKPLEPYLAEADPVRDAQSLGLRVTPLGSDGVRIEVPAPRNVKLALGTSLFLVIWTGVLVALVEFGAPRVFPIIVGIIEFFLFWHVLDLWVASSRIEARAGTLEFASGWFGGKLQALTANEIASIEPAQDVQVGDKIYYSIKLTTSARKTFVLAKRIGGMHETQALVDMLNKAVRGDQIANS
ncbi:MAG: DUF3592 domain-containing protein [Candidatus Hydrogenedentes bacterium]|nr:DUF3592 domain-containing protein [Candidatus Hydrogenedentota bacterium]